MPLGLYISVPFCRTKCTYCNFASDVFSKTVFERYTDRLCADISHAGASAEQMGGTLDRTVDSIYLGGGTPTLLDVKQLERLFVTVSQNFDLLAGAEVTVECAPGTLTPALIETFAGCGVNRVSLGVQSFVDKEAASVGRLHNRAVVLDEIARLRAAGLRNINIDLIAGLPHQSKESWTYSLEQTIDCQAPHVSVYMLEIDEDSRLGHELIAGGTRYHAHSVPDEDLTADLYLMAGERLEAAAVHQYEISNFARKASESRHNLKYWTRQPYLGFGVDAHSMLPSQDGEAVRFSTADSLEAYLSGMSLQRTVVDRRSTLEEAFFLGLRLVRGIDLSQIVAEFGEVSVHEYFATLTDLVNLGLLERAGELVRLTARGRLLSNEVFERFVSSVPAVQ